MYMLMKLLLLVSSLLVIGGVQAQDLDKMMQSDVGLKENYGSLCTRLNDTEFSSLPRPDVHLQKLIDEADDSLSVSIPSGYYSLLPGETLHIAKNLTLVGNGLVVIDAQRKGSILSIDNPKSSVDIVQIGFVNGKGDYGGAITSKAKSLTLYNCSFINNLANYGAGVYQNGDRLSIENSVFTHNYAASKGGAIYANASGKNSPLVVKGCKFHRNNVTNIGAAIYAEHRNFSMESSELSKNGGTAALYASNSSVLLKECNISDNLGPNNMRAYGEGGGARFDSCSATIEKCTVEGNKAAYSDEDGKFTPEAWGFGGKGGGVYMLHSNIAMNSTHVDGNEAFTAGGIFVAYSNLTMNSGSISNNVARYVITQDGTRHNGQCGGLLVLGGSRATLNGVSLLRNRADAQNGAIHNSGLLHLTGKTIISENTAPRGAGISNSDNLTIEDGAVISKNTANEGAGIFNWAPGHIECRATISGNNATYGSAIYNEGNITVIGGEIKDNHASIGGSIWNTKNMTMTGVKVEDVGCPTEV